MTTTRSSRDTKKSPYFGLLNEDLKQMLIRELDFDSAYHLYQADPSTFRGSYSILAKNVNHPLRRLLNHAALGEWNAARQLWENDPTLLRCRGTIYHPNYTYQNSGERAPIPIDKNAGRYFYYNHTAFMIAFRNEEYEIVAEMANHMSYEEQSDQFREIFSVSYGEITTHYWDYWQAYRLLKAVFDAVNKDNIIGGGWWWHNGGFDQMEDTTRQALYAFYNYVKPNHRIQTGLVFDTKLFVEAVSLYDEFNNSVFARSFWSARIEEYLASLLGTRYLREQANGIQSTRDKNRGCILSDGSSYFPFRRPANSIPGFSFFINEVGQAERNYRGMYRHTTGPYHFFNNLYNANRRTSFAIRKQYEVPPMLACAFLLALPFILSYRLFVKLYKLCGATWQAYKKPEPEKLQIEINSCGSRYKQST